MRSLLFILSFGIGMSMSALIYIAFGSSIMLTAGLLSVIALLGALCLAVERAREAQSGAAGGIDAPPTRAESPSSPSSSS